jgi:type I restriction enzyme, S subunit
MKLQPYPRYKPSGIEWLGDVPEHWEVRRLRHALARNDGGVWGDEDDPAGTVVLRSTEQTIDGGWRIEDPARRSLSESEKRDCLLEPGDLVVTKSSGSALHIGKTSLVTHEVAALSPCFSNFMQRLRMTGTVDPRIAFYLLNSPIGRQQLVFNSNTTTGLANLTGSVLGNVFFCHPDSLAEQGAIADSLDRETAKIDGLLRKKRTLLERLKEKRTALISRTVTRGLPPGYARIAGLNSNPKLKPTGIDWLGDVPKHWNVLPFTKYVAEKSDYRGKTPEKTQDGVFLVTAKNVRMGYIDYEASQEYVAEDEYDEIMRRGLPKKGDILFTTEAPLGNVALVDREDVALAQRIIRFRMKPDYFFDRFALYGMMSDHFQVQLQRLSTGSTAEGLKASKLPVLRLVAPPVPEQRVIAAFLDVATVKIDRMVAKVEVAAERLLEYRTALITAAVTGKVDVRGAAE